MSLEDVLVALVRAIGLEFVIDVPVPLSGGLSPTSLALVAGLFAGGWLFRRLGEQLDRTIGGRRQLMEPATIIASYVGLLLIRALLGAEAQTPSWFALKFLASTLLATGCLALVRSLSTLARWLLAATRVR